MTSAIVTALRPGRQRALVQRPRRKIHLASIGAGEAEWATFCDLLVPAAGAAFFTVDAATVGEERPADVCAHCFRMILVAELVARDLAEAGRIPAGRRRRLA